jgi:beta-phosphoglucomutase-like phosphatase (HAD superfamily)
MEKAKVFHGLLQTSLAFMPYAPEILANLSGKKKMALASSSSRDNVDAVVRRLAMEEYFSAWILPNASSSKTLGRAWPRPTGLK